ncbi:MAG: ATP-binding protein [Pseudomonadota bacterium]
MQALFRFANALGIRWHGGTAQRDAQSQKPAGGSLAIGLAEIAEARFKSLPERAVLAMAAIATGWYLLGPAAAATIVILAVACEMAEAVTSNRRPADPSPKDRGAAARWGEWPIGLTLPVTLAHAAIALIFLVDPAPLARLFGWAYLTGTALYLALTFYHSRTAARTWFVVLATTAIGACAYELAISDRAWTAQAGLQTLVVVIAVLRLGQWCAILNKGRMKQRARERFLTAARSRAESALKAKTAFIATMSHELRTPLNGILGMAQNLRSTQLEDRQRQQADVIVDSGQTLNALLTDILDRSKLDAGDLSIAPSPESLGDAMRYVASLYGPLARDKGLGFHSRIDPGIPDRMVFDPVRVRQCMSNLVSNAVKFTEKGEVRVRAALQPIAEDDQSVATTRGTASSSRIVVTVEDTGIGIDAVAQERLFKPFAQADQSISQRFGGTGLGLHIARRLARRMGGDISLDSIPGAGSRFTFTFQAHCCTAPSPSAEVSAPASRPMPNLTGRKILIADDVGTNRAVMRLFLQPLGVTVVEAEDGFVAIDNLRAGQFDLALIDLHMPGRDGWSVIRGIRAGETGTADLPVIAATADLAADISALRQAGFDGIVQKPIDPRSLHVAIGEALADTAFGQDSEEPAASGNAAAS